jgi:ubiquitin-like-conjugating enzyme ATG3
MSLFSSIKNEVHKAYTQTVASLTPTLKESHFVSEGVLTPDEFVAAGDLLVYKCPTWAWAAGEASRAVAYLPPEKQFLITRAVPCAKRYNSDDAASKSTGELLDDDWLATPLDPLEAEQVVVDATVTPPSSSRDQIDNGDDGGSDGDIPDMDDFMEEDNLLSIDAAASSVAAWNTSGGGGVLKSRAYDISITYDKYYQTPRVWLFGYNENRQPLSAQEIFGDVSADHANKTVTLDPHPHLGVPFAYIHPCRHAAVMKKFVARMVEQGKQPRVDQYLLLFLKFLGAVIPTIQYDNTFEIGL